MTVLIVIFGGIARHAPVQGIFVVGYKDAGNGEIEMLGFQHLLREPALGGVFPDLHHIPDIGVGVAALGGGIQVRLGVLIRPGLGDLLPALALIGDDDVLFQGLELHGVIPEAQELEDTGNKDVIAGRFGFQPEGLVFTGAADQVAAGPDLDGPGAVSGLHG